MGLLERDRERRQSDWDILSSSRPLRPSQCLCCPPELQSSLPPLFQTPHGLGLVRKSWPIAIIN